MKRAFHYTLRCLIVGLLLIAPIYLAVLALLKAMGSMGKLISPFTRLLPESLPAEQILSLLLVLLICFLLGVALQTRRGQRLRTQAELNLLERIPGYGILRSLTLQLSGERDEGSWKPALVEIEEALVPGFIIETLDADRYTVFVPSIPTPFAGAVYIIDACRVHPLDVPFTTALRVVSKWGAGAGELVEAMERQQAKSTGQ